VLTDLSLTPDLVHWVIYDIPAVAAGLPANVENAYAPTNVAGAHQAVSVHAPIVGYYGPCPPSKHSYEFAVYALDVGTLPGATAETSRADALTAILAHKLGSGTVTGTYTPP
jgi:Raf kinase inhibitor-like YbhB/YbcL family protein